MTEKNFNFVVTIDGPAGGGKSTAAKNLAILLGFDYLDTGAMYRAAAMAAYRAGVPLEEYRQVADLLKDHTILNVEGRTFLDGTEVSDDIRTPLITSLTRHTADNPLVREQMVLLQRRAAEGRRIVTEGRDQGTEVFPDSPCKFYLTASPEVRAIRRMKQMQDKGESASYDEILSSIIKRDEGDMHRQVGPLRKPYDAHVIDSSTLSPQQVVDVMASIVTSVIRGKSSCES
ncbi:MAG: (d)CMP kinase [Thermoguttaceae bacterium]|nr:(d)CMP kinase [Thermoguttaceae bacterium]